MCIVDNAIKEVIKHYNNNPKSLFMDFVGYGSKIEVNEDDILKFRKNGTISYKEYLYGKWYEKTYTYEYIMQCVIERAIQEGDFYEAINTLVSNVICEKQRVSNL